MPTPRRKTWSTPPPPPGTTSSAAPDASTTRRASEVPATMTATTAPAIPSPRSTALAVTTAKRDASATSAIAATVQKTARVDDVTRNLTAASPGTESKNALHGATDSKQGTISPSIVPKVAWQCSACAASLADPQGARAAVVTHCGHLFCDSCLAPPAATSTASNDPTAAGAPAADRTPNACPACYAPLTGPHAVIPLAPLPAAVTPTTKPESSRQTTRSKRTPLRRLLATPVLITTCLTIAVIAQLAQELNALARVIEWLVLGMPLLLVRALHIVVTHGPRAMEAVAVATWCGLTRIVRVSAVESVAVAMDLMAGVGQVVVHYAGTGLRVLVLPVVAGCAAVEIGLRGVMALVRAPEKMVGGFAGRGARAALLATFLWTAWVVADVVAHPMATGIARGYAGRYLKAALF
ncbi:hypothetical protein GGF31_005088 [Allomyces arbusculus]|nr:hypothetical protein GGF31_005088 [Allomyces arbusculus]